MKKIILSFLLFCFAFLLICSYCTLAQKKYLKGNTHTHSYPGSDDADTTFSGSKAVTSYKSRGYSFLVFTEHGGWWNAAPLSTPDFTVINGSEPGISGNGLWGHFTAVDLKSRISGSGLTHQQMIDGINAQNAIPFINHPRYSQIPITALQIINTMKTKLNHMEIYNGTTAGQSGPTDISVWDSILSTGRLMYGVASDDAHRESHIGKGWIMVYASSINKDTLVKAIRNGDFYSSTGATFDSVYYSATQLFVKSSDGVTIRFIGKNGTILKTVNSSSASYDFTGNEIFVRAEVSNSAGKKAWTQPVMVATGSSINESYDYKKGFKLFQNYPNPFNPTTKIRFSIPDDYNERAAVTTMKIFDITGKEIATLINQYLKPGIHEVEFTGRNYASGIYICQLRQNTRTENKPMLLMR